MAMGGGKAVWSEAPADLLCNITSRLPIGDYIRSAAVCVSWRSALLAARRLPTQAPWLLLPDRTANDRLHFYSISENRTYHLQLPASFSSRIGFFEGWLFFFDDASELHIFDPFSAADLRLPSVTTLPGVLGTARNSQGRIAYFSFHLGFSTTKMALSKYFERVVVSSTTGGLMVAATCFLPGMLVFSRVGDQSWTTIRIRKLYDLYDIIFYKERHYVMSQSGQLLVYHLLDVSNPSEVVLVVPPPPAGEPDCFFKYLVESSNGHLMQVWKPKENYPEDQVHRILRIFVMRDLVASKNAENMHSELYWDELKTLGDQTLFLCRNHSTAVSAQDFPETGRNCIYFLQSHRPFNCAEIECGLEVYNMEDKTFVPRYPSGNRYSGLPIWFTPKLSQIQRNNNDD